MGLFSAEDAGRDGEKEDGGEGEKDFPTPTHPLTLLHQFITKLSINSLSSGLANSGRTRVITES